MSNPSIGISPDNTTPASLGGSPSGPLASTRYFLPVQRLTDEQISLHNTHYHEEVVFEGVPIALYPESRNLLGHIEYIPEERNQNFINNCWVWACTAALEAELEVQHGIKQRLSIQYLDSNYYGGSGGQWESGILGGGDPEAFARFYKEREMAIPWSNKNADYQDGPHHQEVTAVKKAYVDAADIETDLYYGIENISVEKIQTRGVDDSTAIQNIKTSLCNDKPVILSLTFPNKATLDEFGKVWYHGTESDPLDIGSWSREEIDYSEKAAHSMLVVGYEGEDWIVLNSYPSGQWNGVSPDGTSFQRYIDRPHNLLRLRMDLDYTKAWPPGSPCTEYEGCGDACDCALYLTTWEVLNVTFAEPAPLRPSLALDQKGEPHIAFFNRSGALLYASPVTKPIQKTSFPDPVGLSSPESRAMWETLTVPTEGHPGNRYCSLAFDTNGIPHVSFAESGKKSLKYASLSQGDPGTWTIETVCHTRDGIGEQSLVMTGHGPAISYYDYTTRSLMYATKGASGWNVQVVDEESDVGGGSSLRVGPFDAPSISYTDYSRGSLRYAQFVNSAASTIRPHWKISTIDGNGATGLHHSAYAGKYPSLALDPKGLPAITYYAESEHALKYARWDGTQWKIQDAVPLTPGGLWVSFSSFAEGTGAEPRFSMYDEHNKDLIYAVRKPVTGGITTPQPWLDVSMEKVDIRGDVGRHNSLALSPGDVPYIAYYDATHQAVKCAWKDTSVWPSFRRSSWKTATVGGPASRTASIPIQGGMAKMAAVSEVVRESLVESGA